MNIDFMEAVHGCKHEVDVPRQENCSPCGGSGVEPGTQPDPCDTCGGTGEVVQAQMFLRIRTVCPTCSGRGQVVRTPCIRCRGQGSERITDTLTITVPAGVQSGQVLRIGGKGNEGSPGAPAGDLYVELNAAEHEFFERRGDDVLCTVPVSYAQACLGASMVVPTVHGETELVVPRSTPSGKIFTLAQQGAPRLDGRGTGDQYVQVVVSVPKSFSPKEEALLRQLAEVQDEPVGDKGFLRDFWARLTS
jgi:molecular chaperone DnaJ